MLTYVPSECWPQLLDLCPPSQSMLVSLVKAEVTNLPRAVYSLSQAMQNSGSEPVNYSHLPEQSVLRGLVSWCIERSVARRDMPRHPSQLLQVTDQIQTELSIQRTNISGFTVLFCDQLDDSLTVCRRTEH